VVSVVAQRPESTGQRAAGRKVPMALWEKYGLATPGWFRAKAGEPRYTALPRAARFRLALEEGEGLFPVFGQFLAGRADLLPSQYLLELRKIRTSPETPPTPSLEPELAQQIAGFEPIRTAPGSEVFRARYRGRFIVIEVYRTNRISVLEKSWDPFSRKIRRLKDGPESSVARASVLEQFWEWLQVQADIERKRSLLGNLANAPSFHITRFPSLIAELQSPTCLIYEGMQGAPLDQEFLPDSSTRSRSFRILVEAILEQSLLLSLIDTEMRLENFLVLPDGSLGYRALPAWISVPVEWHYELLQYVASSAAGDTPRALQMLSRMSSGRDSYAEEQRLLSQLSSLQPELKVNAVTPESVTVLENYWRALAGTPMSPPPFLQLFHRNLTLLGQYSESAPPSRDPIAEALWPVLGRVLRFHLGDILSTGKGREWAVSSSLFLLTAVRQMALAFENLREDNSDMTSALDSKDSDFREARRNRRTMSLIYSAILLIVFLFSIQLAMSPGGGPFPFLAKSVAVAAAAALCVSIASIK
jgi:predicted unusual protein kinase regulating ubiquinone biosynthesis (AarF/ABC1/UbiB family)